MRWSVAFVLTLGCATPDAGDDELGGSESSESESSETTASESDASTAAGTEGGTDTGEPEPEPERVLFVGNSYTFVNNLPGLFAAMTDAAGDPWIVDSIAVAGSSVGYHVADPNTATALAEGWDVVVIQGQSWEPIYDYEYFVQSVVDFAALVDENTPGADLVLFETWAREDGNADLIASGLTAEEMQQGLTEAYAAAADASGGAVAPVGQAWAVALVDAPQIGLFADDGSHPSLAGSFLANCVFFGVLTGSEAASSDWVPGSLAPEDADVLEPIADALTHP